MRKPVRFLLFVVFFLPFVTAASEQAQLAIGTWQLDALKAHNLTFSLELNTDSLGFTAAAESVQLAEPIGMVKGVKLHCDKLLIVAGDYRCAHGTISFYQRLIGQQTLAFEASADTLQQRYKVELSDLTLADAMFSITVIVKEQNWQLFADTPKMMVKPLVQFLAPYISPQQRDSLTNWSYEGSVKLDMDLAGSGTKVNKVKLDLTANSVNLSDSEGLYITESVSSEIKLSAQRDKQLWQWNSRLSLAQGQAYAEPVFIDFSETPLTIQAEGEWFADNKLFMLKHADIHQKSIMQAQLQAKGSLEKIDDLSIKMAETDVDKLYKVWGQPFTLGTAADNMTLSGSIAFNYQQQGDDKQLAVTINNVSLAEQNTNFSLGGLSGQFGWSNYQHKETINLHWQQASIYDLDLGASSFKAEVASSTMTLLEPWHVPILDGGLSISRFNLHYKDAQLPDWTLAGELTPISMPDLTSALGWPEMHGKLAGVIPNVTYRDQQVKIEGELKVNLFEGETTISDLQLDQPFGVLPQLKANIKMERVNLETLTETFDFGKITGKLNGEIQHLVLSNWQPVRFNALFETPLNDKSRHKISQKAVDNLSQVGGGATGVIQRSALRFFEDFSYQRLGLSCKLVNDVCEMSGIEDAKQGYYIVKGGGLPPRINVVGYTRRVNWPDLIERLKAVSQSNGPVVIE